MKDPLIDWLELYYTPYSSQAFPTTKSSALIIPLNSHITTATTTATSTTTTTATAATTTVLLPLLRLLLLGYGRVGAPCRV